MLTCGVFETRAAGRHEEITYATRLLDARIEFMEILGSEFLFVFWGGGCDAGKRNRNSRPKLVQVYTCEWGRFGIYSQEVVGLKKMNVDGVGSSKTQIGTLGVLK